SIRSINHTFSPIKLPAVPYSVIIFYTVFRNANLVDMLLSPPNPDFFAYSKVSRNWNYSLLYCPMAIHFIFHGRAHAKLEM
ncbi:MAG: hypothetical protein KGY80_13290, partial [Candidatus Thorarchaeota archaeon]|nr:hypothetical protein [Candidatus Thorarchaeota archaeon]